MATAALPIADVRYLWTEVERLKSQVHHLQQAERQTHDEHQRLKDYVGSFVTQAQLDAALCTKISQSSVASSIDRLRVEVLDQLDKKADMDMLQTLQSKKLDISVYESSTWDLKKFRAALEQNVRDLFAQFAHQMESKVNDKLSIEDFDRIFNPEANGQKAAIETAAARIARMNEQLESLQEYVHSDRQRQQKVADLNVSLLDLTRKHNASRNSIAQLFSSFEQSKEKTHAIETESKRVSQGFDELMAKVSDFKAKIQSEATKQHQDVSNMRTEVDDLTRTSQQTTQTLLQIQHFTQNTLLKGVDSKLNAMADNMEKALHEAHELQQKFRSQTSQQLGKVSDKMMQTMDQQQVMEARLRRAEAIVSAVRDDLAAVKGPLMTVARNLREENVAILAEIRRSQDESRDILIDYKGLLEKDPGTLSHPTSAASRASLSAALPPSRPASSAAAASRKHRQQQISTLNARIEDGRSNNSNNRSETSGATPTTRPHTSHGRLGGSPATRLRARAASTAAAASPRSITRSADPREESVLPMHDIPSQRPQSEAGPRPKKSLLYTIGTLGGSAMIESLMPSNPEDGSSVDSAQPEADADELFVFPSAQPQETV